MCWMSPTSSHVPDWPPLSSQFVSPSQVPDAARQVPPYSWEFCLDLAPSTAEGNPLALPEIAFTVIFSSLKGLFWWVMKGRSLG